VDLEMQNRELREAQYRLESSRNRYSDLYDFAPVGYCTLDARGRIQDINLTGASLLRTPKERLVDSPLSSFVWKEDRSTFRTHLRNCDLGNGRAAAEVRLTVEGRGTLVAQLVSVPLRDAGGRVAGYRTAIVDITTLTQFEDRLRFLADLGDRLASTLDLRKIVTAVAELAVPFLADVCVVDRLDDAGRCSRVEAVFNGPTHHVELHEASVLEARVFTTEEPWLVEEVGEGALERVAQDPEHLRILRRADAKSLIIVPLRAGSGIAGAITFAIADSHRRYGADDLVFAQEIARRASLAMDNARSCRRARTCSP
jgi:PAS domain S-box-containing protein